MTAECRGPDWNTPDVYATWTFLLHLAVLVLLTYFVSLYKPKGT